MATMYRVFHEGYHVENENLHSLVMWFAHRIRKDAARKFNVAASEIIVSECLKWAWEIVKSSGKIENYKDPSEILRILKSALKNKTCQFSEWEKNFLNGFTTRRKNFSAKQEACLVKMFLNRPQLRTAA